MAKNSLRLRVTLGFSFLLVIIVLISGLGIFYLNRVAAYSDQSVQENYLSLEYARHFSASLQELPAMQIRFLSKQELDTAIYESHQRNMYRYLDSLEKLPAFNAVGGTFQLRKYVDRYFYKFDSLYHTVTARDSASDIYFSRLRPSYLQVRNLLNHLRLYNQEAIIATNNKIQFFAERGLFFMTLIAGVCLLVTIGFIFYFPPYLAKPIEELHKAIDAMSRKDYDHRMYVSSITEFRKIATAFNRMAEHIKEYENINVSKILLEKKRIEGIIDHLQDGIIGVSGRNRIIFLNQVAEILLDITESEVLNAYLPNLMLENDVLYHVMVDLIDAMPEQLFAEKTITVPSADRELFFSRQVVSLSDSESTNGLIIILKNITKFTEMDAAKTHFVATISHELKTPLSAIRMSLNLLKDKRMGLLNTNQLELITEIEQATTRLFNLTGEILQLSQVEAGKVTLNKQPIQVATLINHCFQVIKVQAEQKGILLEADIAQDLPTLEADLDKLKWIINNLLANAVKFSPIKGKVKLKIYEQEQGIVFSVTDQGIGIAPIYHKKIFEKYFQVPNTNSNLSKKGSGLGLAICREFTEAHKGEIWVESELGKGATFFCWLPL